MTAANSTDLVPVGRSRFGPLLYDNPCPSCGKARQTPLAHCGKLCKPCSLKSRSMIDGGIHRNPIYKLLRSLESRCHQPNGTAYDRYGALGIFVWDGWRKDPLAFIAWAQANGYAKGLHLDRIDPDGPYAPWNCRFLTPLENTRRSRKTRCTEDQVRAVKTALSEGKALRQIERECGVTYMTAWHIRKGNSWADI